MGFPATEPAAAVAAVIDAAIAGLTLGTNLFTGLEKPAAPDAGVPHAAVFVVAYGGSDVVPYMGQTEKLDGRDFRVQVLIRSDVDDEAGGLTMARAIMVATNRITTGLPTGYFSLRSLQPCPAPLGRDNGEHYTYTVNVLTQGLFEG